MQKQPGRKWALQPSRPSFKFAGPITPHSTTSSSTIRPSSSPGLYIMMSSDDEYDEYFVDLPWDEVGKLLDAPVQASPPSSQQASSSRSDSTRLSSLLKLSSRKPSNNEFQSAARLYGASGSAGAKRGRSPEPDSPGSSLKKMKLYAQKVLKGFEEDYSCPICFDLIVGCHLTNPCGHSACGSCSTKWAANKTVPTCFACRAPMNRTTPVIPGLLVDNVIEKQINLLAENGDEEWQERGAKRKEWDQRKAAWAKEKSKQSANENVVSNLRARRMEMLRRAAHPQAPEVVSLSEDSESDSQAEADPEDASDENGEVMAGAHRILEELRDIRRGIVRDHDILRYPRVSRRMLQIPVVDNPNDADYVPDTQNVASSNGNAAATGPVTRMRFHFRAENP